MAGLVGTDAGDNITHGGTLGQLVVVTVFHRGSQFPELMRLTDVCQHCGISLDSLVFQISNISVAEFRVQEVANPEEVEECTLESQNEKPFQVPRFDHIEKCD